jgi:putative inorganic carbon (HCO3(-)) transporter
MKESQDQPPQRQKSILNKFMDSILEDKSDLILIFCFLLICVLYALLMVNDRVPLIGLISLGLLFLLYYAVSNQAVIGTPMDVPILGLLILLPINLSISINWAYSLPKVHGVLLGVALFMLIVNYVRTPQRLHLSILGLVVLAIGISLMGLIGTDWPENKLFSIPLIYDVLPKVLDSVPRSTSGGGIHANILGGSLTFLVPLLASLIWDNGAFDDTNILKGKRTNSQNKRYDKIIIVFILIITGFILLLTQSRGAYLGTAVGLLALAIWKDRRFLWLIPILVVTAIVVGFVTAEGDFSYLVDLFDLNAGDTLPGRLEIWRRALYLIQDFPITGSGIGTFGELTNALYPYFTAGVPQIPHTHNTLLAVAVDLGLPALILYSALLSCFTAMIWCTYKTAQPLTRVLLIGLGCGLLAHQVFGLMDAYTLGTKLGFVMWIYFGLVTALFNQSNLAQLKKNQPKSLGFQQIIRKLNWQWLKYHGNYYLFGMSSWILFSLVTIAFSNINIIVSLIMAIILGFTLGALLTIYSIPHFISTFKS